MLPLHAGPEADPASLAEGGLLAAAALVALVHGCGWRRLRRLGAAGPGAAGACAFQLGLVVLVVAVASPLDALADRSFAFHMTQHVLLMLVAPPLLWLGSPYPVLLLGLPRRMRRRWVAPLLRTSVLRSAGRWGTRPAVCWLAFMGVTWAWHLPAAYEWALHDELVHDAEHLCFLGTGLWFWWPVVRPWPARPTGPQWSILPYLALAMLANTVFSAIFTFSDRVFYPSYLAATPPGGLSPLDDQALGGAVMWMAGSLGMLVPGVLAVLRLLAPSGRRSSRSVARVSGGGGTARAAADSSPPG